MAENSGRDDVRQGAPAAPTYPAAGAARAIMATLVMATMFSYIDRTILSLLVGPIRHDFSVNDLQVSLLLGPTFALFFALTGVPLGWAADRTRRLRLAAIGMALWSLMTVLSGLAHEFWQLLIARVGVAVGEAVLLPTSTSLVADSFRPEVRTRMLGLLGMSIYWGTGMALLTGGLLINAISHLPLASALAPYLRPWQLVLILVGAPGLLIAAVLSILPEPARQRAVVIASFNTPRAADLSTRMGDLLADYGGLFLAVGLMAIVGYSLSSWAPSHLVRAYGWSAGSAGVALGVGFLVSTTLVIWLAATSADRLALQGRRDAKYIVAGCCTLLALPATLAIGLIPDARIFVVATSLVMGCAGACIAMGPAAVCEISTVARRGRAVGTYQTVVGLIGAGLGPPLIALAAKLSNGRPDGLGFALCRVTTAGFLVATLIFWARRKAFARAALTAQAADQA